MVKFYAFARKDHPRQGKHNALQKGAYFAMPWLGALSVVTGIAIWKPVEFSPLTNMLGGYAWARYWHFIAMAAIVVVAMGHIFMVFAVDPYALRSMITGDTANGSRPKNGMRGPSRTCFRSAPHRRRPRPPPPRRKPTPRAHEFPSSRLHPGRWCVARRVAHRDALWRV